MIKATSNQSVTGGGRGERMTVDINGFTLLGIALLIVIVLAAIIFVDKK